MTEKPEPADAADGTGFALCHMQNEQFLGAICASAGMRALVPHEWYEARRPVR